MAHALAEYSDPHAEARAASRTERYLRAHIRNSASALLPSHTPGSGQMSEGGAVPEAVWRGKFKSPAERATGEPQRLAAPLGRASTEADAFDTPVKSLSGYPTPPPEGNQAPQFKTTVGLASREPNPFRASTGKGTLQDYGDWEKAHAGSIGTERIEPGAPMRPTPGREALLDQSAGLPSAGENIAHAKATGLPVQTQYGSIGENWQSDLLTGNPKLGVLNSPENIAFRTAYQAAHKTAGTAPDGSLPHGFDQHATASQISEQHNPLNPTGGNVATAIPSGLNAAPAAATENMAPAPAVSSLKNYAQENAPALPAQTTHRTDTDAPTSIPRYPSLGTQIGTGIRNAVGWIAGREQAGSEKRKASQVARGLQPY